ncbi:hypothetical protein [Massilibacterium senegalense]|uniref:hypothetical protein n=1 Tax=Massilibacterium senegalense TaxID=1632858 RepID=UPI0007833153|nr:hypothetical protein [Massilibacterium senegalense]
MTKDEIIRKLTEEKYEEILELIEDAENGEFEVLELAPSLGLIRDPAFNQEVIQLLDSLGITIEYVEEEDEE